MSDENTSYSMITVTGCPVSIGCNKSFYIDDPSSTGYNRLWRTNSSQRIFWQNGMGWCIADLNGPYDEFEIYFYSQESAEHENPWDVTSWYTQKEAFQDYNPILIGKSDPEIIETTETIVDNLYVETIDTKFQVSKTYYASTGLTDYPFAPVDVVIIGKPIPENTYYHRNGSGTVADPYTYTLTEDVTFNENHIYYTRTYTKSSTTPYVYMKVVFAGKSVPEKSYYEVDGTVTKVIKTTKNNRTGEITQDITQTVSKAIKDIDQHKRYTVPQLETGKVYRFSFVKDFQELGYIKPTKDDFSEDDQAENDSDITRGIFRIEATTKYYDMVVGGIDVYQNLYLPLGISKEVYEVDKKTWMNDDVWYKLVDPMLAAKVYYVPTAIIEGIPDGNVTAYDRYHMIIDIGIFNDPDFLTELVTCVNMLFKAHFGIPTTAQLATYDKVWLPSSYYEWMDDQREVNINEFMSTRSEQYFNTLFKNEYNKLEKENTSLRTQVKTYEELIATLTK